MKSKVFLQKAVSLTVMIVFCIIATIPSFAQVKNPLVNGVFDIGGEQYIIAQYYNSDKSLVTVVTSVATDESTTAIKSTDTLEVITNDGAEYLIDLKAVEKEAEQHQTVKLPEPTRASVSEGFYGYSASVNAAPYGGMMGWTLKNPKATPTTKSFTAYSGGTVDTHAQAFYSCVSTMDSDYFAIKILIGVAGACLILPLLVSMALPAPLDVGLVTTIVVGALGATGVAATVFIVGYLNAKSNADLHYEYC
jgi:hypothetical protein